MNPDGTNVRKVFKQLVGRQHPTWSPDGNQFAYHRFNKLVIYIASNDGKDDKKLTNGLWPAWSPDGTEIAFVADEKFAIIADRGTPSREFQDSDYQPTNQCGRNTSSRREADARSSLVTR